MFFKHALVHRFANNYPGHAGCDRDSYFENDVLIRTVQFNRIFRAGSEIRGPLFVIAGYKKYLFDHIIYG